MTKACSFAIDLYFENSHHLTLMQYMKFSLGIEFLHGQYNFKQTMLDFVLRLNLHWLGVKCTALADSTYNCSTNNICFINLHNKQTTN